MGLFRTNDASNYIIEQQRINLETLKQNEEILDKIRKKEKELMQAEKQNAEAMREVETKRQKLEGYEAKLTAQAEDMAQKMADNKRLLAEQKETYQKVRAENERAATIAKLAEKRMPYLESLANEAAVCFTGWLMQQKAKEPKAPPPLPRRFDSDYHDKAREAYYAEFVQLLQASQVMWIESDTAFQKAARDVIVRYADRNLSCSKKDGVISSIIGWEVGKKMLLMVEDEAKAAAEYKAAAEKRAADGKAARKRGPLTRRPPRTRRPLTRRPPQRERKVKV